MDNWRKHQFFGIALISFYTSYLVYKKYGFLEAVFLFYCMISSAFMFQTNIEFWDKAQFRIETTAAQTYIRILAASLFALFYEQWRNHWQKLIVYLTILNCFLISWVTYGIFNASSFDSAMVVCCTPLLLKHIDSLKIKALAIGMILFAMVRSGNSATAYFSLLGVSLAFVFKLRLYGLLFIPAVVGVFATFTNGAQLVNSSRRVEFWDTIMQWWSNWVNPWYGSGIGSYAWLGPLSQIREGQTNLLVWLHNDYLQLLYEGGIIGLILGLVLWIKYLLSAFKKDTWLFCTFAGLSVSMLTYYPFHWFVSQLLILGIMCEVKYAENNESQYNV